MTGLVAVLGVAHVLLQTAPARELFKAAALSPIVPRMLFQSVHYIYQLFHLLVAYVLIVGFDFGDLRTQLIRLLVAPPNTVMWLEAHRVANGTSDCIRTGEGPLRRCFVLARRLDDGTVTFTCRGS